MKRQISVNSGRGKYLFGKFSHGVFLRCCFAGSAIILCAHTSVLHANEYSGGIILTESLAVNVAIRANPNLAKMQARYEALAEIPPQQGTLPDPVISLNAMNLPTDSYDLGQEAMTQIQVGISQVFPFPGKLELRKDAAVYDAKAAGHSVTEARLQLVKHVKSKWWQLYYMDRALETVDSNQELLRQFITITSTKYETGEGMQQDVLLSQLELSRLMEQRIQLQAIRRNQSIQLNILMAMPANESIVLSNTISKRMPTLADEDRLYQLAAVARPRLKQVENHIDAAQSRFDLARRGYYPDFKLGVSYGDRSGDNPLPRGGARSDFVSVMVGIKVPLYADQKQSKAVSQKSLELQKNRYALADEKGRVNAEISTAVTDYHGAIQQFSLLGSGIVPQAQQTVQSMLAAYQVGEVDFLNVVRSQMTLFNYELQYWRALSDAKQAIARLEAAVGKETIYE